MFTWSSLRYVGNPPQNIFHGPSGTTVDTTPGMCFGKLSWVNREKIWERGGWGERDSGEEDRLIYKCQRLPNICTGYT